MSKGGIAALGLFYKIDRIPSFDIRYSVFDIRYSLFFYSSNDAADRSIFFDQTSHFSGQRRRSYETTPEWHCFFFDLTGRSRPEAALI